MLLYLLQVGGAIFNSMFIKMLLNGTFAQTNVHLCPCVTPNNRVCWGGYTGNKNYIYIRIQKLLFKQSRSLLSIRFIKEELLSVLVFAIFAAILASRQSGSMKIEIRRQISLIAL